MANDDNNKGPSFLAPLLIGAAAAGGSVVGYHAGMIGGELTRRAIEGREPPPIVTYVDTGDGKKPDKEVKSPEEQREEWYSHVQSYIDTGGKVGGVGGAGLAAAAATPFALAYRRRRDDGSSEPERS